MQSHPGRVLHVGDATRALHCILVDLRHPDGAEYDEGPEENHVDPLEEDDLKECQEVDAELHVLRPAQLSLLIHESLDGEDTQMGQHDPVRCKEEDDELQDHRQLEGHGDRLAQHGQLQVDHEDTEVRHEDESLR